MEKRNDRQPRRGEALSKSQIVDAAIAILDAEGEVGLTFRALAAKLATGAGALYWYVSDKDALLAAATDATIGRTKASATDPREAIRALALAVYDAIEAHPWVGTQLAREPWQSAMLEIFERIGQQLMALGVPDAHQFDIASALQNFILGAASQSAAAARLDRRFTGRLDFLASIATDWTSRDAATYPFLHRVVPQLSQHDDRQQFLAGIELILRGIAVP